jgi:MFS transporter, DHA1 family, multidrug resistance protein
MAWLPERSQAPLGWFYVAAAAGLVAVLTVAAKHTSRVGSAA